MKKIEEKKVFGFYLILGLLFQGLFLNVNFLITNAYSDIVTLSGYAFSVFASSPFVFIIIFT